MLPAAALQVNDRCHTINASFQKARLLVPQLLTEYSKLQRFLPELTDEFKTHRVEDTIELHEDLKSGHAR